MPIINTEAEARRCLQAVADYLRRKDDSPRAASDVVASMQFLCALRRQSWLTPTCACPDGSSHVLRCVRCEIPA